MRAAYVPDDLWRSLIDDFEAGILLLDADRVVVYANAAAAKLLDYALPDTIGLDAGDLLALCQPGRLDIARLRTGLTEGKFSAGRKYAVTTTRRRLSVQIFPLADPFGMGMALVLRPLLNWQADLITRHTLNEMHGPLTYASDYVETLLENIQRDYGGDSEVLGLARVAHASVRQLVDVWETLRRLDLTGAWALPTSAFSPIRLEDALHTAQQELANQAGSDFPDLEFESSEEIPSVSGAPQLLHVGLCALLEGAAARLRKRDVLDVWAEDRHHYVEVVVTAGQPGSTLLPHLLDELPFAIAEQAVLQHGGRIWFDNSSTSPACCFSLPVWRA